MVNNLTQQNKTYWQSYKPGEIPSVPKKPSEILLKNVGGPILDVGTGDGVLAEKLALKGFDVYGVDIAENIINENRKRKSKVKYSTQDITTKTRFSDNYFDLIIFRFTLTNIHKELWKKLGDEVFRILKTSGKVWALEPLVSKSYKKRYELASGFIKDRNCVYVFYEKELARKINNKHDLNNAIKENKVSRIVKHYTVGELRKVLNKLSLTNHRIIKVVSPSGFVINTFEGVFLKD